MLPLHDDDGDDDGGGDDDGSDDIDAEMAEATRVLKQQLDKVNADNNANEQVTPGLKCPRVDEQSFIMPPTLESTNSLVPNSPSRKRTKKTSPTDGVKEWLVDSIRVVVCAAPA